MSNEEEKRCPLCAEEMDWTDQQLKPCKCGYEVCVWCWHHIMDMAEKDATEGRCPACRIPYDKDRIVGLEANFQRVAANSSNRKQKQPKPKQKPNEVKKDLSNVRVIQRKMAYIIGLPLSLAYEDLLQRKDYFGQYGKVTKVSLSRTAGGTVQQFVNDTCSVYITYSKEEEAVRCIQSVHGYVLDGRFLRASFGTAKYCHAWLRNMPCNNLACLYLHSIGAEEDSFGKDEIAAVHTRNRVEEIVGAAQYLHKRSGRILPPPVDEHLNNLSASAEEPVFTSCMKDVAGCGDHLHFSKDNDGLVRSSKHMTTFVDIVGRPCNSGSDRDVNSVAQGGMLNLCSDMSSLCIDKAQISSDLVSSKASIPGQFVNGVTSSKLYSEPFREASKLHSDLTCGKNSIELSHKDSLSYSDDAWCYGADGNAVNNYADEGSKQSTCRNSVLNDGYNEKRFQSLAKSDRIYRCSKSFSNEEIVEHLRRLDDDSLVNDDENSAAVESSIISNILSMDFDDSVLPAGLFEGKDGSSWNFQNSDQSRFSFANEHGYNNQDSDRIYKPRYQASRAQNLTPPGFSKPPPPGFPLSGSYVKNSLSDNHYRTQSIGSDDLMDPAIMVVGRGKSSSFDMRFSSFNEEAKLWILMQQQQTHHHQFSQTSMQQQFPYSRDDYYYGDLTSRLVDQQQYTNGYQHHLHLDGRSEVGLPEQIQRKERLGLDKLYGECTYQVPSSGDVDVYTRVFGM